MTTVMERSFKILLRYHSEDWRVLKEMKRARTSRARFNVIGRNLPKAFRIRRRVDKIQEESKAIPSVGHFLLFFLQIELLTHFRAHLVFPATICGAGASFWA
ncbi:hypothetical protein VNO77_34376 [Canavalia gladiata]|uniref:Uncharacterized protein n=1 Tax=Canavalia gladiata TaxID=3824 RepID=A0AAN9Q1Q8_CANGL